MTDITIKGKFTIEGLSGFDNVKLPLRFLKLKLFPIQQYMIEALSSYEEKPEEPLNDNN